MINKDKNKYDLLPEGLKDLLQEEATKEVVAERNFLDHLQTYGYKIIKPPIMEYEENLLSGMLFSEKKDSFRLMDTESKRLMTLRADITPQIARIASTRLKNFPRPLRLVYSGEVLRNDSKNILPDRQFKQIGAELIGPPLIAGLFEIISSTIESLYKLNLNNISIDFTIPALISYLNKNINFSNKEKEIISEALINKDISNLSNVKFTLVKELIKITGPLENSIKFFKKSSFPKDISFMFNNLFSLTEKIIKRFPNITITIDPLENTGFKYYNNLGFNMYDRTLSKELAIGGDYLLSSGEIAIGISLMLDQLVRSFDYIFESLIYIPFEIDENIENKLRDSKNLIIKALELDDDPKKQAIKLGCKYIVSKDGKCHKL